MIDYIATFSDGHKESTLVHHGIKGQKHGFRRWQNLDGSLTPEGRIHYGVGERVGNKNKTVFVSGSSKTQDKSSGYYLKKLPYSVRYELKDAMKRGDKIIVGDAPGIDRQTQDYLAKKHYTNVEVFSPGKDGARYLANPNWKQTNVDKPGAEIGSKEWLAAKDIVMSNLADKGIAVTLDEGAKATRKNVDRLVEANKEVMVYELGRDKGVVRNFLSGRSRETTFVNGKEVPEDYDNTDLQNSRGEVPTYEYGTRTREIVSGKMASKPKNDSRVYNKKDDDVFAKVAKSLNTMAIARPVYENPGVNAHYLKKASALERFDSKMMNRSIYKEYIRARNSALSAIKALDKAGYTNEEIAKRLHISESKLNKYLYG